MKLYCFGQSGHSYKVANYLNLAGIPFETQFVDFFHGETRSPEFLALNPMGEAPVLVAKDQTLTQSGVILQYLVDQHGAFAPTDPYENLRWVLWDNHKLSSVVGRLRFMMNFMPEDKRNADVTAHYAGLLKQSMKTLNAALEGREFLLGEAMSPADFSCSSYLWYPEDFTFKRADYPAIDAWLGRIETLPNWQHPYDLMPTDQAMLNQTPAAKHWHREGS